jgi:hypothetical protein
MVSPRINFGPDPDDKAQAFAGSSPMIWIPAFAGTSGKGEVPMRSIL